jgi:hypothetical protein
MWKPVGVSPVTRSDYILWGSITPEPYTLWRKNGKFMVHLGGNMWRQAHAESSQILSIAHDNKAWEGFKSLKGKVIVSRYANGSFAARSYIP